MNRTRPLLLAMFLATGATEQGPGPAIPDRDLLLQIDVEATHVEFGKAFALSVQRVWSKDLWPEPWDDSALAPLVLRAVATETREDARHIEETRHFMAFLFRHGKVSIGAAPFRARPKAGGLRRETFGAALEFEVRAGLDPANPGSIEVLDLLPPPTSSWFAWAAAAILAGLSLLGWNLTRRAPGKPPEVSRVRVEPHLRAEQRLLALRALQPTNEAENRAFYVEASDLLRSFIEARYGLGATRMTTDEFLSISKTHKALEPGECVLLTGFLELCDLAKFAGTQPQSAEREQLLDTAAAFLRAARREGDAA